MNVDDNGVKDNGCDIDKVVFIVPRRCLNANACVRIKQKLSPVWREHMNILTGLNVNLFMM